MFVSFKFRKLRCWHAFRMREDKDALKILAGKPSGEPRNIWEDNIRVDLR